MLGYGVSLAESTKKAFMRCSSPLKSWAKEISLQYIRWRDLLMENSLQLKHFPNRPLSAPKMVRKVLLIN
jgi:hypothetical protein